MANVYGWDMHRIGGAQKRGGCLLHRGQQVHRLWSHAATWSAIHSTKLLDFDGTAVSEWTAELKSTRSNERLTVESRIDRAKQSINQNKIRLSSPSAVRTRHSLFRLCTRLGLMIIFEGQQSQALIRASDTHASHEGHHQISPHRQPCCNKSLYPVVP